MLNYISLYLFFNNFLSKTPIIGRNSCTSYSSYYKLLYSWECYYDPNVFSTQNEILSRYVNYETYKVTTKDGFVLTLHRIPKHQAKGIVILQHPVTTDAIIFLLQGETSLALDLHREGYEIWLPNHRGTPLSSDHKTLNSSDPNYWDFGFHEIAIHDYQAIIEFISRKTGRRDLILFGHSMAATAALVYASLFPTEAGGYLKAIIAFGPAVYFGNSTTAINYLLPANNFIYDFFSKFSGLSFLVDGQMGQELIRFFYDYPFKEIFILGLNFFFGFNGDVEAKIFNVFVSNFAKPFSLKIFHHFSQLNKGGDFRMYDYGWRKNLKVYGSFEAPLYPLGDVGVPVHLIVSKEDSCSTVQDSERLFWELREDSQYGKFVTEKLNHYGLYTSRYRFDVHNHLKWVLYGIFKK